MKMVCKAAIGLVLAVATVSNKHLRWDKDAALHLFKEYSNWLGIWGMPVYIATHTLSLALCLPYAVFFEAGASLLFGFVPGVVCVFLAKIFGASLSFWVCRLFFKKSRLATRWAQNSKYFHTLNKGVARDGWKIVLLARFSPIPSYVINYAIAATDVSFFSDFLLPTVIGCLPTILQNTSIGSLAGTAVASASSSQESHFSAYLFPMVGIISSIFITLKLKQYSAHITATDSPLTNSDKSPEPSCVHTEADHDDRLTKHQ